MNWQQGLLGASLVGIGILIGAQFKPQPPPANRSLASFSFDTSESGKPRFSFALNAPEKAAPPAEAKDFGPCQAQWARAMQYPLRKIGAQTGYLQTTVRTLDGVLETLKLLSEAGQCQVSGASAPTFAEEAKSYCAQAIRYQDEPSPNKPLIEACLNGFARYTAAAVRDTYRGTSIQTIRDVSTLMLLYLAERERARNGPPNSELVDVDTLALTALGRAGEALDRILALEPDNPFALRYRAESDLMVEFLQCSSGRPDSAGCLGAKETVDRTLGQLVKVEAGSPFTRAFLAERGIYRKDFAAAEAAAARLEEQDEKGAAHYYRAWIQHEKGNRKAFVELLARGVKFQRSGTDFWSLPLSQLLTEAKAGHQVAFPPFSLPVSHSFEVPVPGEQVAAAR